MKKIFLVALITITNIITAQSWEWTKLIQPADNKAYMTAVADPAGNVCMGGFFNQSIDFGNSKTLSGNWDGCIARFDTAGLCQWAQRIYVTTQGCGCTVEGNRSSATVAGFDSNGNVIVYGGFCGCGEEFGGISSNWPGYNIFVAKYSPSGTCLWVQTKPGSYNSSTGDVVDMIQAVTIDKADNIYLSIYNYATNTTFCGLNFPNQGLYFAKINNNGGGIWVKCNGLNTASNNVLNILTLQQNNNKLYAGGIFFGTSAIGTNTFTASGYDDAFIAVMDTAANILYSAQIAGGGAEEVTTVTTSSNSIVTLANTDGTSVIISTHTLTTGSSQDKTFLISYDTSLNVVSYTNTATDNNGRGTGLYSDNKGNLYLIAANSVTTGFGNLSSVPAGNHVIRMDNTLTNYWHMESVSISIAPDTLGNIYTLDGFSGGTGINGALGKIRNARTTGIDVGRMAQTNTMQIYPNPSSSLFNLKLGANIKHDNAKITLYDISGKVIVDNVPYTKQDENTLQIDLTKYAEGSYIIKAEVDNVLYSAKLEK